MIAQWESSLSSPYTLSLPLKWASTSANSEAQCRYDPTLHALFFQVAQALWPIRAATLFTPVRFPLPVFKSGANLVEQQFWICIVIGCRLPDAEEIALAGSAFGRWITGSWRPLGGHSERFVSGNRAVAAHVNFTLLYVWGGMMVNLSALELSVSPLLYGSYVKWGSR